MFSSTEKLYYDILRKKLEFEEQHDERNFIICKSCFWCALLVNRSFNKCPSCMDSGLESMPISLNEIYTFDFDPRQGVSLGFWNKR
jgi:hypothetical protein